MTDEFRRRTQWLASAVLPHEPALRAWLQSRRFPGIDVDDVIQETYSVLAGLESVDHVRNAKAYLFQAARSVVMDELRHARVVSMQSVADVDAFGSVDQQPSPETQTGDRQELKLLAEAIAGLTGKKQEVFILRKIHGLGQREVAARLGISESAVENHVARAIEALGKIVGRGRKRNGGPSIGPWRHKSRELKRIDGASPDKLRDL